MAHGIHHRNTRRFKVFTLIQEALEVARPTEEDTEEYQLLEKAGAMFEDRVNTP